MPQVCIQLGSEDRKIQIDEGSNLLFEAASRAIPIPYRCTRGNCGTCVIQVIEGLDKINEVLPLEEEKLGNEAVRQGYRLACQTHVYGDVTIKVNRSPIEGIV
jgi:ferredoxin